MSATSAPSKALKVRPPEAKHYKLRHPCTLPNSLTESINFNNLTELDEDDGVGVESVHNVSGFRYSDQDQDQDGRRSLRSLLYQ